MRESQTTYTLTCDRCGLKAVFHSENDDEMHQYVQWKSIGTGMFVSLLMRDSISVDLCPDCIVAFRKDFMQWLPPAFKKAMGE